MYTKHPKDRYWAKIHGVRVYDRNGDVTEYASLKEAVIDVGYTRVMKLEQTDLLAKWLPRVWHEPYQFANGTSSKGFWLGGYWTNNDSHQFFTSEGIRIPLWKLQEAAENFCPEAQKYYRRYWRGGNFKFRDGPVEGIRCHRAGRYRGYRHIQTHQEIRENDFLNYDEDALEYDIKARGRRRRHNLPTPWDDIRVYDYYKKSWKNYRKHQWKE